MTQSEYIIYTILLVVTKTAVGTRRCNWVASCRQNRIAHSGGVLSVFIFFFFLGRGGLENGLRFYGTRDKLMFYFDITFWYSSIYNLEINVEKK